MIEQRAKKFWDKVSEHYEKHIQAQGHQGDEEEISQRSGGT